MTTSGARTARKVGPGKAYRQGLMLIELAQMFSDEAAARMWFERQRWPDDKPVCPRCESPDTASIPHAKPKPCRVGPAGRSSPCGRGRHWNGRRCRAAEVGRCPLPVRDCLKGVSSMKLHRVWAWRRRPFGSWRTVSAKRGGSVGRGCSAGRAKSRRPLLAAQSRTNMGARGSTRAAGWSAKPPSSG